MLCLTTCVALALFAADTGVVPAPPPPAEPVSALAAGPLAAPAPLAGARLEVPLVPGAAAALPAAPAKADTTRGPFEYSDAYGTRLTIHKVASYAMIPLFAAQYLSGRQLLEHGEDAPEWARSAHGPLAAGVATLFAVNTVTGAWNLWEARRDPEGRTRRTLHGVLMLLADAGFAATGALAEDAEESQSRRDLHRTVALTSVGVSLLSYAIMLPVFGGGN